MQTIITYSHGNFSTVWTLHFAGRSFYLGQDVKVARRMLRMEPREIMQMLEIESVTEEASRIKIAEFIVDHLGLDESNIKDLQDWELAVD